MSICVSLFKIYVLQKQNRKDKWSEKDIIFKITIYKFYILVYYKTMVHKTMVHKILQCLSNQSNTHRFDVKFEHILHVSRQGGEHGIEAPVVGKVGNVDGPDGWASEDLTPWGRQVLIKHFMECYVLLLTFRHKMVDSIE